MKKIAVMGSTGSIGTQALDVVRNNKEELEVTGLGAGKNIRLLEKQAREFSPSYICVEDENDAKALRSALADTCIEVGSGREGLIRLAQMEESGLFLSAIVGMKGILPTVAAINAGKDIALANKETLVTAGHIIMPLAAEKKVRIIPVDSEHSAIYQCLQGAIRKDDGSYPLKRIWLTASGGPFRGMSKKELETVTVRDALKHPNWSMGTKVTIDSASMVNKGLEVMEAHWLFNTAVDDITVLIQPKSIIHSMVEFNDGAVLAQLGPPDMRMPIQYALLDGKRGEALCEPLDFTQISGITFDNPDNETFKGLPLAMYAARTGGSMPTVFNAANEAAVRLFVRENIKFLQIYDIIEAAMASHKLIKDPSIEDILAAEQEVYKEIESRN